VGKVHGSCDGLGRKGRWRGGGGGWPKEKVKVYTWEKSRGDRKGVWFQGVGKQLVFLARLWVEVK
jgi:hypothetical protein